ncbi:uncharacterized protein A4U43_C04F25070 [Asparagus officinalis]|uniref:Pectate lyase superfamily protein domain-containing protein n=1 Tax=Asparagus officinalis TaxID=4686 RepID=A0A5P1F8E8_ASPOF|nr:uncharacterized protein A4U43_C04F25070 [Asparagus officinalis]
MESSRFTIACLWALVTIAVLVPSECTRTRARHDRRWGGERGPELELDLPREAGCRAHVKNLTEFGGVGDGATSNTKAFNDDVNDWPLIDPLPSYGRGRDSAAGGRYSNLIMGSNLTDVIITGNNGTINGQGKIWWDKYKQKKLDYTRGYLLEILYSDRVLISNLTFKDSPSWNIHPVYCTNVVVSGVTILAPVQSPNTDGIDPDSCSGVRIEDCFIISGDDCIAIKSGWDEYGIKVGLPSEHIIIRRLTCISPTSAVIAIGSEMYGGRPRRTS